MSTLNDKRILVTGGTGSIGSTLVKKLVNDRKPKLIRVFSRDDTKQFDLMNELPKGTPVDFLIGDVRDGARLMRAMEGIDVVFHAAAMKHVSLCEKNAFETYRTNVEGTQNVIDCALASGVDRVVCISTDKAVHPFNILGASKLMAERLVLAGDSSKGGKITKFCCVRFGNVLWSRGSVLPLFVKQMRKGEPLTLTDPAMTRFFMSMSEAAGCAIKASESAEGGEIFVLKMPAAAMGDVAKALQELMVEEKIVKKPVPVKIIGAKEGERLHEILLTREESENVAETQDYFVVLPPHAARRGAKKAKIGEYSTLNGKLLAVKELKVLLKEGDFYKKI